MGASDVDGSIASTLCYTLFFTVNLHDKLILESTASRMSSDASHDRTPRKKLHAYMCGDLAPSRSSRETQAHFGESAPFRGHWQIYTFTERAPFKLNTNSFNLLSVNRFTDPKRSPNVKICLVVFEKVWRDRRTQMNLF